jgi:hypothetical protein
VAFVAIALERFDGSNRANILDRLRRREAAATSHHFTSLFERSRNSIPVFLE